MSPNKAYTIFYSHSSICCLQQLGDIFSSCPLQKKLNKLRYSRVGKNDGSVISYEKTNEERSTGFSSFFVQYKLVVVAPPVIDAPRWELSTCLTKTGRDSILMHMHSIDCFIQVLFKYRPTRPTFIYYILLLLFFGFSLL